MRTQYPVYGRSLLTVSEPYRYAMSKEAWLRAQCALMGRSTSIAMVSP
jgi:hypothetical protein